MDDLFRALSAGTKFRKPKGQQQTSLGGGAGRGGSQAPSLAPAASDPSLDFFRSSVPASAHANKRPREVAAAQDRSGAKSLETKNDHQGQGADDPEKKKSKKGKRQAGDSGAHEEDGGVVQVFAGRKKPREEVVEDHDEGGSDDDANGHVR